MPDAYLVRNVRPWGQEAVDVLVRERRIAAIQAGIAPEPDVTVLEGEHALLLPGLVNAHAHIDKTFMGLPWQPNSTPGRRIRDYVDNERRLWNELELSAEEQAAAHVRASLATGTTHIRTHVDIDPRTGPGHIEGVLATREAFKDVLRMQIVAFPQGGLLVLPGTLEMLESALAQGAEVVGGLDPSTVDRDPVRHLDTVFGLAEKYGVEVDIHLHEPGMLGAFSVELIAERTRALGMQGRVTISHVFCLGQVEEAYLQRLIELLLENEITIMSLGSARAEFPPIQRLYTAGVRLCTGTDGVRDAWGPYNSADMLDRLKMLGYRCGFRKDEEIGLLLDIATYGGARVMKDDAYGLELGKTASFVVVAGDTHAEAVVMQPTRKFVFSQGRLVMREGELTSNA